MHTDQLIDMFPDVAISYAQDCCSTSDEHELFRWLQDHYLGEWPTVEHWAADFLEDTDAFQGASDLLERYFDYEAYTRDLQLSGELSVVYDGPMVHVFWG